MKDTKKDFSKIIDAYEFFKKNSNEYNVLSAKIIGNLTKSSLLKKNLKILDFGGGDGKL